MLFKDRNEAGRQLIPHLKSYLRNQQTVVVGLARGGVITAFAVAEGLGLPLQVMVVRKIGAPGNEELALGAIAENGEGIFNDHLIAVLAISPDYIKREIELQKAVAKKRSELYQAGRPKLALKDKTVILIDDGIATGASIRVAIRSLRAEKVGKIVLAVPVAAPDSLRKLEKEVDEVICLSAPLYFEAVGSFYRSFDQTSDEEIIHLLKTHP
jgi:putative phosphoribosyl transferase